MSATTVIERADLCEELERHIHSRTDRRLQRLEIRQEAGHAVVRGQAPSYYVRQLAEQAAMEMVPTDELEFAIQVESPSDRGRNAGFSNSRAVWLRPAAAG